ncbi:MAG: hypothetical protein WBA01_07270, partial [Phormidesmis sp.]
MKSTQLPGTQPPLQGTFCGAHGLRLFFQSWYPPSFCPLSYSPPDYSPEGELDPRSSEAQRVKGVFAIVHGLGEHSGRYCTIVEGLT